MYVVFCILPQVYDQGRTVGHTEYFPDGTAKFCFTDSDRVSRYKPGEQMTNHARQYEMINHEELGTSGNRIVTGNLLFNQIIHLSELFCMEAQKNYLP